jgi:hypothetical protein
MSDKVEGHPTDYGFVCGPVEIERTCQDRSGIVLTLITERQRLTIRVTPSGLIRVGAPVQAGRKAPVEEMP